MKKGIAIFAKEIKTNKRLPLVMGIAKNESLAKQIVKKLNQKANKDFRKDYVYMYDKYTDECPIFECEEEINTYFG